MMARLLTLQGDPEGKVACSECLKRTSGGLGFAYLFNMPDESVEQYELRGTPGKYERRESAPTHPAWEPAPEGGDVTCASCRMNENGAHRTYSLKTGLET